MKRTAVRIRRRLFKQEVADKKPKLLFRILTFLFGDGRALNED